MASLEKQAQITAVFFDEGYFPNAENTKKMSRAPFDVVLMQNTDDGVFDNYIQPLSIGASEDWAGGLENIRTGHERSGIGFIADTLVIPESNLGDHAGQNNWRGCFKIGMV